MASAATISLSEAEPEAPKVHASDISSIKALAESKGASHIPSTNHSITDLHDDVADELAASIPVIDLSFLTSHDPQIHTKALYQLGKACAEWGLIMVSNFLFQNIFFPTESSNEIHFGGIRWVRWLREKGRLERSRVQSLLLTKKKNSNKH